MPTVIGPGGTNKNYEMFNIAEKFLGIIMDKEYQLHIIELH